VEKGTLSTLFRIIPLRPPVHGEQQENHRAQQENLISVPFRNISESASKQTTLVFGLVCPLSVPASHPFAKKPFAKPSKAARGLRKTPQPLSVVAFVW